MGMFQGHQSCGSCKEGIKGIHYLKIVSEYDHTTIKKQQEDKLSKAISFLFPIKINAKLERT